MLLGRRPGYAKFLYQKDLKTKGKICLFLSLEGEEKSLPLAETPLRPGKPETRLPSSRLNQQLCRRGTGWV